MNEIYWAPNDSIRLSLSAGSWTDPLIWWEKQIKGVKKTHRVSERERRNMHGQNQWTHTHRQATVVVVAKTTNNNTKTVSDLVLARKPFERGKMKINGLKMK